LEHLPHPRGVVALRGMPQSEEAHLVEAARQHMLEEAAHEFMAAQTAGSSVPGLAFLISEGDRSIIATDNAGIGEGDAKDVAGEIIEYRLFALTPGCKEAQEGLVLTEAQVQALERAKEEKEAHGEFESECPGYCGAQDTFYVGTLKGVGRIYQQTFICTNRHSIYRTLSDATGGERQCTNRHSIYRTLSDATGGERQV
jgi:hypothetical protein